MGRKRGSGISSLAWPELLEAACLSRTGCLETGKLKEHSKVTSTSITNPVFAVQGQLERGVYNLQHVLNWVQTCYSASRPLW